MLVAPSALLARLLPQEAPQHARAYDLAARLWCAGALVTVLRTFRDYGVTWDESPHLAYGVRILRWYGTGFSDTEALTFRINYLYGGAYDLLGGLFRGLVSYMDGFTALHLLGGLVGVVGLYGTWRLGRALGGPRVGLLALVMLTLHPVWYGHMFNNPKDEPFAVAYVWSLCFMVEAIAALPRPSRGTMIKLAVAIGLALGVRIAGLILLCYLGLVLALFAAHAGWVRRSADAGLAHLRRAFGIGLKVAAGAWVVMLIGWPWAQLDPIRRPFVALRRMSKFDAHERRMPFAGEDLWNYDIGWQYLPHYFGLQTPELVLGLLGLGTIAGLAALIRGGARPAQVRAALALLTVGMAIYVPPLYAMLKGSPLYDGYRHFLFVVPPMVVLAALAFDAGLDWVGARLGRVARAVVAVALVVALADLGLQMVRLHPHQYVYFNRLAGGVAGAVDRYDTDYYGNTFREAMQGLQAHLWRTERDTYLDTIYYFSACVSARTAHRYVPQNFRSVKERPDQRLGDFHVGYLRYHCDRRFPRAPVIFAVEREGARLNVVKDLRGLPDTLRTEAAGRQGIWPELGDDDDPSPRRKKRRRSR